MKHATLHFDGSCYPTNPGVKMKSAIILQQNRHIPILKSQVIEHPNSTCNKAEILALIMGLDEALRQGITSLRVFGDSKNTIKYMNPKYKIRKTCPEILRKLISIARAKRDLFKKFSCQWVPREQNQECDKHTRI